MVQTFIFMLALEFGEQKTVVCGVVYLMISRTVIYAHPWHCNPFISIEQRTDKENTKNKLEHVALLFYIPD